MSWIIHVGADIVSEIMFSVAYSDLAVSINDSIEPTIQSIVEIGITKLKLFVTNFIFSDVMGSQS